MIQYFTEIIKTYSINHEPIFYGKNKNIFNKSWYNIFMEIIKTYSINYDTIFYGNNKNIFNKVLSNILRK